MGFTSSQQRRILSLYLKRYFFSEITRMSNHDPHKVDRYLSNFERMCDIAKNEAPLGRIHFLTGLGKRLVKEYLRMIKELKVVADPNLATSLSMRDKTNGSGLTLT